MAACRGWHGSLHMCCNACCLLLLHSHLLHVTQFHELCAGIAPSKDSNDLPNKIRLPWAPTAKKDPSVLDSQGWGPRRTSSGPASNSQVSVPSLITCNLNDSDLLKCCIESGLVSGPPGTAEMHHGTAIQLAMFAIPLHSMFKHIFSHVQCHQQSW